MPVSLSTRPCELHELTNCSVCTGADKRLAASLEDPAPTHYSPPPQIPGGPTIRAKFAGNCTSCGRRWQPDELIHHPRSGDGWIGVDCCVPVAR